ERSTKLVDRFACAYGSWPEGVKKSAATCAPLGCEVSHAITVPGVMRVAASARPVTLGGAISIGGVSSRFPLDSYRTTWNPPLAAWNPTTYWLPSHTTAGPNGTRGAVETKSAPVGRPLPAKRCAP